VDEVEVWLPVVGYEELYEVSDLGRVRSLDRLGKDGRRLKGRVMKLNLGKDGYPRIRLADGLGNKPGFTVASLVIVAFTGPRQCGLEVRHLDGNSQNNHAVNLVWGTHLENEADKKIHGTHHMRAVTSCPLGHEHAPWNNVASQARRGHRKCLACDRAQASARSQGKDPHGPEAREGADRRYEELRRASHIL
jgi:hypothetical protein